MERKEESFEVKTTQFFADNIKTMAVLFLVVVLAGLAYLGYGWQQKVAEAKSQEDLFAIQKGVEEKERKLTKDDQPEATPELPKGKKAAAAPAPKFAKTPESLAANFASDLKSYDNFIASHHGQKSSFMAAIQAARLAKDYQDNAQAEKILEGVVNVPAANDLFSGLLRAQLSAVLMDENKCPEALKELNQIVDNKAQSYFHAHSWLRLGACYIETKEWDKAQTALGNVEKDFANTQAANEAKQLKRLALLKSKGG